MVAAQVRLVRMAVPGGETEELRNRGKRGAGWRSGSARAPRKLEASDVRAEDRGGERRRRRFFFFVGVEKEAERYLFPAQWNDDTRGHLQ
jgi:hypothetical protein